MDKCLRLFKIEVCWRDDEDDVEMEIENGIEDSPLEISFRARQEWRHHKSCNFKVSWKGIQWSSCRLEQHSQFY